MRQETFPLKDRGGHKESYPGEKATSLSIFKTIFNGIRIDQRVDCNFIFRLGVLMIYSGL